MAQKDKPKNRHGVFCGGKLGVGPQLVGGFPELCFYLMGMHGVLSWQPVLWIALLSVFVQFLKYRFNNLALFKRNATCKHAC